MKVLINGVECELGPPLPGVEVTPVHDRLMVRSPDGTFSAVAIKHKGKTLISFRGQTFEIEPVSRSRTAHGVSDGTLKATMPGLVIEVYVEAGQQVDKGRRLLVMEAMKTQMPLLAPFSGVVAEVRVEKGRQVQEGETLVRITE